MSPQEGEGEADEVDEEEGDTLRVLVGAITGFSTQIGMQTLTKAYLEGRVVRQGDSDLGIRVKEPKGKGLGSSMKMDLKGKAREVDDDDDMEVAGEIEDDGDEDKDADAGGEVESLV
ncbi:hypothetical protein PAXRUDRAFT_20430 [Paxillus rubicundulus Ve08.2h10]|uniref:Uncharacterized protein n=1 Tax=Paxillus rubicundulus Ve08.2h10 TaxID=930991 RepID=A0A0D0CSI4_9AGAM|nr:hypothetical protein PAXRUDRAFT_20430 [Paxillus rubicundulus Ve08.2h10]